MSHIRKETRAPRLASPIEVEQVLALYYEQFMEWASLLTRADHGKAQDLVHDFCVHLVVAKPDMSAVSNLNGYLYTSLRHIYLSTLARSAREAMHFLTVADFDSIRFAFDPFRLGDSLQTQNDLRKICQYCIWRKDRAKSASYFILRFFHGYLMQEIADLSCSPIAALYPKLKGFRAEMRSYLEEKAKVRIIGQSQLPSPVLRSHVVSSIEIFQELRQTILAARTDPCLPEEELLAIYSSANPKPIPCSYLSHFVSCERCLALIDRYFDRPTLNGREPLDEKIDLLSSKGSHGGKQKAISRSRLMESIRKSQAEVLEHRPQSLSIAVNGKVIASHSVQAQHNVLSSRIEHPEQTTFVEVFSEQGIRLAQLSIDELPPHGPHERAQHVDLNDGRWLDLHLTFDGLGLSSELVYFDPALTSEWVADEEPEESVKALCRDESAQTDDGKRLLADRITRWFIAFQGRLRLATLFPVAVWSLVVASVAGIGLYLVRSHVITVPTVTARAVLNRSIQVEAANLQGQTEHQVLRFEEASSDGSLLAQGSIDLWKDGDGRRYIRRLYDQKHRMLAAVWKQDSGRHGEYQRVRDLHKTSADQALLSDNLWKQDLSPVAFRGWNGENAQIRPMEDGYELTVANPDAAHPQLLAATLVLDHRFHPIRQIMRVRHGNGIRIARLILAEYNRRPTISVPDTLFNPKDQAMHRGADSHPATFAGSTRDVQLAALQIAVLYQLYRLNADFSEPIEVNRTADGYIHIAGVFSNERRKREILSRLNLLENHQLLKVELSSAIDSRQRDIPRARHVDGDVTIYDVDEIKAPATAMLHRFFQSQGMADAMADVAAREFSSDALKHSQAALQHASALNRLGSSFTASELRDISIASQQQWVEMAEKHAVGLQAELQGLSDQLAQLSAVHDQSPGVRQPGMVFDNMTQFKQRASQLLLQTQRLNRTIGSIFASGLSSVEQREDVDSKVIAITKLIPLEEAREMTSFAVQLNASAKTALNRDIRPNRKRPSTQP